MISGISKSSLITAFTFGSVTISGLISIVWLLAADGISRFEPAVSGLGLLGGLAGILAERRATAQERRHLALLTLVDELRRGTEILADPKFSTNLTTPAPRVYPRLPVSATDATLISGALMEHTDAELLGRLHHWRDEVNGFNRRLELTENRIFTTGMIAEITDFDRTLHRRDGYLSQIIRHLKDLQDYIAEHYRIIPEDQRDMDDDHGRQPSLVRLRRWWHPGRRLATEKHSESPAPRDDSIVGPHLKG